MRRAQRWFTAVFVSLMLAGCASSSDVGGEAFTAEDALWTGIYLGIIVLGFGSAQMLLESNE